MTRDKKRGYNVGDGHPDVGVRVVVDVLIIATVARVAAITLTRFVVINSGGVSMGKHSVRERDVGFVEM